MFINPQLMANREISWQLHLAGTARFCDYFVPIRRVLRAASLPQHLADRGQPHLGNVLMFAAIIVIVQFEFRCSFITRHNQLCQNIFTGVTLLLVKYIVVFLLIFGKPMVNPCCTIQGNSCYFVVNFEELFLSNLKVFTF